MKIDVNAVNGALQAASVAFPQISAAYAAYRAIWSVANPGKTEADYLAHLDELSKANVSAADAILIADGFVRDESGNWKKPTA